MGGARAERYKRQRARILHERGDCCQTCGSTKNLEMSHIRETGLKGMSRGRSQRIQDWEKHPEDYLLNCEDCHTLLDELKKNLKKAESR